jgi:tetratricopeptide (TPR) repeat protein
MPKASALLIFLLMSICTLHGQSNDEINTWISEADAFKAANKYQEAATLYKRILDLRPDYNDVRENLNEMEDHLLYGRIVDEVDVKYDSERYLVRFGSKGKYYNEVRDVLGKVYEEQTIKLYGEVSKLMKLYSVYEMNLSAQSAKIAAEIAISARDSAKKSDEMKDWAQAIYYDEIALKYEKSEALQKTSQHRIDRARKKIGKGTYTSVGYLYNAQMPFGIFASRLKKDQVGWYFSMQFNGAFFNNFSSDSNFGAEEYAPGIPRRDILFVTGQSRGFASINIGANYPIYKSLYAMAGVGILHTTEWNEVEVYRRDANFGPGLYQNRVQSGSGFSDAKIYVVPEIGLEYKFWSRASVRYSFLITNQLNSGSHNFGIAFGLIH